MSNNEGGSIPESNFDADDNDNNGEDDNGDIQDNFEAGVIANADDEFNGSLTLQDPKIASALSSE